MHRISDIQVCGDCKLRLTFANEGSIEVDFASVIGRGGIFAKLADREFFSQVKAGDGGRFIEWPDEIDACADALWIQGSAHQMHEQEARAVGA